MTFRASDVQRLFQVGLNVAGGFQSSVFLGSGRKLGKTSVLRQVYERLLREQGKVVPFLYSVPQSLRTVEVFAGDCFQKLFLQFLAFNRRETQATRTAGLDDVQMLPLAYETRFAWLVDSVRQYHLFLKNKDLNGLVKFATLFPEYVALNTGLHAFVLVDDFHHLGQLASPEELAILKSQFLLALQSRRAPFLLAGTSRPTFRHLYSGGELCSLLEPVFLEPLELSEAVPLFELHCREHDVPWDPLISSVIVEQLGKNPFYLQLIARAAKFNTAGLRSSKRFAELYLQELIQGSFHQYFTGLLGGVFRDPGQLVRSIELLEATSRVSGPCPIARLRAEQKEPSSGGLNQLLQSLDEVDLIDFQNGIVTPLPDRVLYDWVGWNTEHRIRGRSLTQVKFDLISELLRRFQQSVEDREMGEALGQIKDTLNHMNQQIVSRLLFDYAEYHANRGEKPSQAYPSPIQKERSVQLPLLLSVESRSVITLRSNPFSDPLILARGYEGRIFASSREIAWLVGYCPSSETIGLNEIKRFHENAQLVEREDFLPRTCYWLVAKERFNQAALSYARESKIFTSNIHQLNQLSQQLMGKGKVVLDSRLTSAKDSYELSIPIVDGSEMVAVRAFEQVAESLEMEEKSKNQFRMALLEACVQFKEYFASQAERIYLIFEAQPNRLDIHLKVEVDSIRFPLLQDPFGTPILKTLLDDVRFAETPRGFELVLSKFLSTPRSETL
jgi:hypothetical protein